MRAQWGASNGDGVINPDGSGGDPPASLTGMIAFGSAGRGGADHPASAELPTGLPSANKARGGAESGHGAADVRSGVVSQAALLDGSDGVGQNSVSLQPTAALMVPASLPPHLPATSLSALTDGPSTEWARSMRADMCGGPYSPAQQIDFQIDMDDLGYMGSLHDLLVPGSPVPQVGP